jgi:hypothetical protein
LEEIMPIRCSGVPVRDSVGRSRQGRRLLWTLIRVAKSLEMPISGAMHDQQGSPRRRERIVFETDRHMVVGDVTLPPEGYQSRFSDAVNRADVAFIPLLDVEISPIGGGMTERHAFIVLAKEHVRLAYPFDGAG